MVFFYKVQLLLFWFSSKISNFKIVKDNRYQKRNTMNSQSLACEAHTLPLGYHATLIY